MSSIDVRCVPDRSNSVRWARWEKASLEMLLMGLLDRPRVSRVLEVGLVKRIGDIEEMLLLSE